MTSPLTLQDGSQSGVHAQPPHHVESEPIWAPIPRVKSTTSLMSHQPYPAEGVRSRMSFDDASDRRTLASSSLFSDRDTGLRRIRQYPSSRSSTSPNQQRSTTRSTSLNLTLPSSSGPPGPSGPPSPLLAFTEDLQRFPQESLHSFSFAHQSEESLHKRQNVLKKSIDFVKDKTGWAANNPGIYNAQAKVNGDQEVQSMMELLERAQLLGPELHTPGPLTGPADSSAENLFEKSFKPILESPVESPVEMVESNELLSAGAGPSSDDLLSPLSPTTTEMPTMFENLSRVQSAESTDAGPSRFIGRRSQLKRTFTDIDSYNIRDKLSDAMARPYMVSDHNAGSAMIAPRQFPTMGAPPKKNLTISSSGAPHSHGTRQNAAAQAIFTTDARAPWTITAANDLACLVFGVTKAEVRKMGIMEVIQEENRKWLEGKLRSQDSEPPSRLNTPDLISQRTSPSPSVSPSPMGGSGVTAKLLSKPASRHTYKSRRARTADGNGIDPNAKLARDSSDSKSRGVLLCGDVVPIQKRNGAVGSASLWVKEKQGGLIWVLEEIAEDVAMLSVDEVGCVTKGTGSIEAIFGLERIRRGMDIKKILPELPKQTGTHTGALDYDQIAQLRRFTARTSNSINIPVTVDLVLDEPTFRVSSFPHIAGIMVLSAETLKITSSNSVFAGALFGHDSPDGLHITELIPLFDSLLALVSDEDDMQLKDGIVIPEHSFRRARALLAVRDGRADAASIFLRPSGLPAKHRDGSEIMIDVQMRVVKSDRQSLPYEDVIAEDGEDGEPMVPHTEVVYALWITYSRQLHAVNHGVGQVTPLIMSRPGTPPRQPSPGQALPDTISEKSDDSKDEGATAKVLAQQLQEASSQPIMSQGNAELFEHPSPASLAAGVSVTPKKAISDFVILEEMGKGAYGEVKLVRYRQANAQKMVMKYVTKRRILVDTWTRDRRLGTVPLEIHVLDYLRNGLQHPNIIEMADFFEDDTNYYIEMLPHGLPGVDLFDYIELRVNMEERECRQIFVQVASALHHLHVVARVVHRDIKDENVVLDGEGAVKLVDFGSAAYIKSGPFDVFVGTIDYAAPEVLRGLPYRGKEQDVWALGILLYTIVYKENPFYSIDEIMDHDLRVPYVMSEDCIDLIRRMLDRDVDRRINIQDVLDHPWCTAVVDDEDEDA